MKSSSFKQNLVIGLTLFSMFFGAGNLIFAPFMGVQAGSESPLALAGFVCTAVVLPITAILIITLFGDALNMVSKLSRPLAIVFITLIYLLIGPLISIPRTASTSFEMFDWLLGNSIAARVGYSILFFAASSLTALRPGKIKDVLGKIMTPILLVMIFVLCFAGFLTPSQVAAPAEVYAKAPFASGFIDGYQTMDILAAFCFGTVIIMNIKQSGIEEERQVRKVLIKASLIAGFLLALIYVLLGITGMMHSVRFAALTNGAQVLSRLAAMEFGSAGKILVSLIFLAACYNVCTGLLCCLAEYFLELTGKMSYRFWLAVFAVCGAAIATIGLDAILAISAPILFWICPIALALLFWGVIWYWIQSMKTIKRLK